ncbi:hypothetical protein LAUMK142_03132 [Mycobacterium pseudokansasii]|uniref:Uncharacterized protein n=1 Tax=Mycobacterium pseudokansasii TaxID=2341080 RepID=A0A498QUR9_9MYCO|nr:hypothetical protein LAUMK142_03132 [Mycobacterium pseudokansasii]
MGNCASVTTEAMGVYRDTRHANRFRSSGAVSAVAASHSAHGVVVTSRSARPCHQDGLRRPPSDPELRVEVQGADADEVVAVEGDADVVVAGVEQALVVGAVVGDAQGLQQA